MLQLLRDGTKSIVVKTILFGLLLLATLGLVVMDVQGMFSGTAAGAGYVARIDGNKITTGEFDRLVQMQLHNMNMPLAEAYERRVPEQILTQEIDNRLFALEARKIGLLVDDATAAAEIRRMMKPLLDQGMPEKAALQQMLRSFGLSEGQLVNSIKNQVAMETLVKIVAAGVRVPQAMIDDALKYKYEWRSGEYITLTAADAGELPQPTDVQLQDTYKSMTPVFMQPESRTIAAIILDKKSLGVAEAKVTDADVRAYYDANAASFAVPVTRSIAQVIVKDEALAQKIAAAARASKNLSAAAAAEKQQVVKGTYADTELPEELAGPVFSAAAGEVTEAVESPLGWHVIQVEKENPRSTRPFESVSADIRKKLEGAADDLYEKANALDDEIAAGKTLVEIAQRYNVKETLFENVRADGNIDLPEAARAIKTAFALHKDEASQLIELKDGRFLIVSPREITQAAPRPFDQVRDDVARAWKTTETLKRLQAKAEELVKKTMSGTGFADAAREAGKAVQRVDNIQRGTDGEKAGLPGGLVPALFSASKAGVPVSVPSDGKVILVSMTNRKVDVPEKPDPLEVKAISALLEQSLQSDILIQYRQGLYEKYNVKINDKVIEALYSPKTLEKARN